MIIEIVGWFGSLLIIYAYAMNIFKKMASDSIIYYTLNILGSGCLIINTVYHHALPSAAINIVWILIAISALLKRKAVSK